MKLSFPRFPFFFVPASRGRAPIVLLVDDGLCTSISSLVNGTIYQRLCQNKNRYKTLASHGRFCIDVSQECTYIGTCHQSFYFNARQLDSLCRSRDESRNAPEMMFVHFQMSHPSICKRYRLSVVIKQFYVMSLAHESDIFDSNIMHVSN